ncbi:D-alanyl-D-alanine carboxypeptidase/D-alanyl-D-alanine endopeptidase [Rudanella lutea]|uniref:D-alanyl-D-alanine carboxypeptidase/D-alanyl-D-alanine endopeptidase n=1 Tax=Rudanella lutea TaxID=451374 RepID=UPI00036C0A5E|nr:D-alanyl-D-alanine carboxypeptidase/D-alanyl-D-alanine-endopeptidase [Rudanella lutea]
MSISLILGSFPLWAQSGADSTNTQRLLLLLDQFQQGPVARHGTVALSVRRVSDGEPLIGYNSRQSLSTASTLKLVTTATALAVLGGTYSYTTVLEYDGPLRDSTLTGNLYIRGSGDPSLGTWRYSGGATLRSPDLPTLLGIWSDAIRRAGIRRIEGRVIGDGSIYNDPPVPDTWPYGDLGNYYGAGLSGLNLNENLYRVFFRPGKTVGAAATLLRTDPPLPYLTLHNTVSTDAADTGDQVNIYGAPLANQQWLTGKIPIDSKEFSVKGSLPDPAYFAAYALTEQLRRDSVRVGNEPAAYGSGLPAPKPTGRRTLLYTHRSPALTELAQQTNFQSVNLYAEALLRTAALRLNPGVRNTDEAVETVAKFWRGKGVNLDGFRMRDGSGLSTVGGLSADNMTGILARMGTERTFPAFYETIPVVGQSGTVRSLARNTAAAGNVRAKSGSIEGVRAYAGYFTAADGELMTFSVMVNRFTPGQNRALTAQLERILAAMVQLNGKKE